jgi:EAL domain-containing protein (putative c-di-GMP-specific phosphodiesterase class I)
MNIRGTAASGAPDVGATVIAEGVEQAPELAELQDLGVPWAQGFYLGRPEASPDHGLDGRVGPDHQLRPQLIHHSDGVRA